MNKGVLEASEEGTPQGVYMEVVEEGENESCQLGKVRY